MEFPILYMPRGSVLGTRRKKLGVASSLATWAAVSATPPAEDHLLAHGIQVGSSVGRANRLQHARIACACARLVRRTCIEPSAAIHTYCR
ncbi:hypothetical protein HDV63DRAFT_383451 [Trichoderma sp. SZMC 28014]